MLQTVWEEFLKIVKQEAGSQVVETWLKAVVLERWDSFEKTVYIHPPNVFVKQWIRSNYLQLFQTHLSRLLHVDSLKVVFVDGQPEQQEKKSEISTHIIPAQLIKQTPERRSESIVTYSAPKKKGNINKAYQFDTFVVGSNNQLAYAAANAITEKLGKLYNPLFIYGNSGLGKTHLLHAIGNGIRAKHKKAEVLYQTADRFVSEFINSIRFDKVHQFQSKYRSVDVLLIDDVQFISNKEQTQEAFFHIFNALYDANKQIVFSSDTYPANMQGLAERMRSRLEWGLVTDIQPPSIETKIAILKRKAELNNEPLDDECAAFIADCVNSNIRELEGALIRVLAFASLTKQAITLELAQKVLQRPKQERTVVIDFEKIATSVCKHYECSLQELRSNSRNKQLSHVRHITMYLCKRLTTKSLRDISFFLHRKDHSTILHGITKIQEEIENNEQFAHAITQLEQEIGR